MAKKPAPKRKHKWVRPAPLAEKEEALNEKTVSFIEESPSGKGLLVERELAGIRQISTSRAYWAVGLFLSQRLNKKTGKWGAPRYTFIRYQWRVFNDDPRHGFWKEIKRLRMGSATLRAIVNRMATERLFDIEDYYLTTAGSEDMSEEDRQTLKELTDKAVAQSKAAGVAKLEGVSVVGLEEWLDDSDV